MKRTVVLVLAALLSFTLFAQALSEKPESTVVASTAWTAAFADIAGVDNVDFIAPATMTHPPEYEITISDVQKINNAEYFLYAGYEVMMKSMGTTIKKDESALIHIQTNNSIENVRTQSAKLAKIFGTEAKNTVRFATYEKGILEGKENVAEKGLDRKNVYCHAMQVYLAKDLGLNVVGTFGPAPLTAAQLAEIAKGDIDIIIDNIHNPVAPPALEVSPKSRIVTWRNLPDRGGRGSLEEMVRSNIAELLK
jgi:hypothetical protein